jgi:hypothetical protein
MIPLSSGDVCLQALAGDPEHLQRVRSPIPVVCIEYHHGHLNFRLAFYEPVLTGYLELGPCRQRGLINLLPPDRRPV